MHMHDLEEARTAQVCMTWRGLGWLKCAWPGGDQDGSSVHDLEGARTAQVCMTWRRPGRL